LREFLNNPRTFCHACCAGVEEERTSDSFRRYRAEDDLPEPPPDPEEERRRLRKGLISMYADQTADKIVEKIELMDGADQQREDIINVKNSVGDTVAVVTASAPMYPSSALHPLRSPDIRTPSRARRMVAFGDAAAETNPEEGASDPATNPSAPDPAP